MHLYLALLLHSLIQLTVVGRVWDNLCPSSHVTLGKLLALPQPCGNNACLPGCHEEQVKDVGEPPACSWCMVNVSRKNNAAVRKGTGREAEGSGLPGSYQGRRQGEGRRGRCCPGLSPDPLATYALSSSPTERPSAQAQTTPPAASLTCGQTRS